MTSTPLPYSYKKGSQQGSVYIFDRNKDDRHSSSEDEIIPLKSVRSRNKVQDTKEKKVCDTLSHQIQPSDTLASLSIKYNCKVSDLKRINHIWNANELSARDTLLIPVVKHSLLLDTSPSIVEQSPQSGDKKEDKVDIRTISITSLSDSVDTKMFLERMNSDIETLLAATREKTRKTSLSEVKSALTIERIFPKQVTSRRTGSSPFCTLAAILLCAVFLFVFIPVTLVYWDVVQEGIRKVGR